MGRMIMVSHDSIDPPEPMYEYTIECPECGAELHEGEKVYRIYKNGSPVIVACEYCINSLEDYVEDL